LGRIELGNHSLRKVILSRQRNTKQERPKNRLNSQLVGKPRASKVHGYYDCNFGRGDIIQESISKKSFDQIVKALVIREYLAQAISEIGRNTPTRNTVIATVMRMIHRMLIEEVEVTKEEINAREPHTTTSSIAAAANVKD